MVVINMYQYVVMDVYMSRHGRPIFARKTRKMHHWAKEIFHISRGHYRL